MKLPLSALALAGLAIAAAPASATEGSPTGAPPLPNPLAPVTISPAPAAGTRPGARPRVLIARVTPRKVVRPRRSRLRVGLATPGRLRIVVDRRAGGRRVHVWARTVRVPGHRLLVRLPGRLPAGRYRVTAVSTDTLGRHSRAVHRQLIVLNRD